MVKDNMIGPYELNSIITGDARELSKAIPDESVDLIFTDPEYDKIEDYEWLAETAARVLKPDSACLVYIGIGYLDLYFSAFKGFLDYLWTSVSYYPGKFRHVGIVRSQYSPCLFFKKGNPIIHEIVSDVHVQASRKSHKKYMVNGASWAKDARPLTFMLKAFTKPNATIFDPFTGGGTVPAVCKMLDRNYLAFEIDPNTAEDARQRVRDTQPPLPIVYHEQGQLL